MKSTLVVDIDVGHSVVSRFAWIPADAMHDRTDTGRGSRAFPRALHLRAGRVLFFAASLLMLAAVGVSTGHAKEVSSFRIETREASNGKLLVAVNRSFAPISVRVELSGNNIAVKPRSPVLTVVPPKSESVVARIEARRNGEAFRYQHKYSYQWGAYSAVHDAKAIYRLPFPDGLAFRITQAFGGVMTTHDGPESEHAIDFAMPEGTLVLAARGGQVIETVDHFTIGSKDRFYSNRANLVRVIHSDGTIAHYLHLAPNSIVVAVGDWVEAGAILGRSGNTGYSSGPHLHFAVTQVVLKDGRRLISRSVPTTLLGENPTTRFLPRQGTSPLAFYGQPEPSPATPEVRANPPAPLADMRPASPALVSSPAIEPSSETWLAWLRARGADTTARMPWWSWSAGIAVMMLWATGARRRQKAHDGRSGARREPRLRD